MTVASMTSTESVHSTRVAAAFSDPLSALSAYVTYTRAESYQERAAIFQLRYQSYLRAEIISPNAFARFTDDDDHAENAYLLALHVNGKLASSLRLHVSSQKCPKFPSFELFPKPLQPLLEDGGGIVDLSHVAANETLSGQYRVLPYVTLRPWIMAAEHFKAKHLVATVKSEHLSFYERAFNCRVHGEFQQLPHRFASAGLVTLDFTSAAKQLYGKYPFLNSSPSERQRLFERDAQSRQAIV